METLRALGPLGVFLLAVLDSAGIPVVGGVDALLIWISVTTPSAAYIAAAAAVAGSVIGSMFLFYVARKGGEAYLDKYTSNPKGARLKSWFQEYGLVTVFVPAMVPIIPMPLKVFVLSAGALGIRPVLLAAVLLGARAIRYGAIAWLGLQLGANALPYLRQHVWQLVLMAAAAFVSLYLFITIVDRRRKSTCKFLPSQLP